MPKALLRACPRLGCVGGDACTHKPKRAPAEHRKIYKSKRWLTFRARILKARRWCERCLAKGLPTSILAGCTETTAGLSQDVHHKIDLVDGGAPFDPDNVEALSHRCHSRETRQRQRLKSHPKRAA